MHIPPMVTTYLTLPLQVKMTVQSEVTVTSIANRVTGCWFGPAGWPPVPVRVGTRKT